MSDLQSFLDAGTAFEGKISFTGTVRIDGQFNGDADADGTLVIGEDGSAQGTLALRALVLLGEFSGEVIAKERVEIGPQAQIEGVIRTPRLIVSDGAVVSARVEMG